MRFTVLASGSSGNASFLCAGHFGLLLDFGLGPRLIGSRLASVGFAWRDVHAALLTHTHGDHWSDRTLGQLRKQKVPLYCHARHQEALLGYSSQFPKLQREGLVRTYEEGQAFDLSRELRCLPVALSHDAVPTFGFRLEGQPDLLGQCAALAYAADLGTWTTALAQALADVDLLALEFNHDVDMQLVSGRSPELIQRILGEAGHLSNAQAAELVLEVIRQSPSERLQRLVQLHVSRECNRPELAVASIQGRLESTNLEIYTARQDRPSRTLTVGGSRREVRRVDRMPRPLATASVQPFLPGLELG